MMKLVIVVFSLFLMGVSGLAAQEGTAPTSGGCDYVAFAELLASASEELLSTDSPEQIFADLKEQLLSFEAECLGLAFESDVLGLQPVIGPVDIPEGIYRVTATTDGFMIAELEVLEGSCERDGFGSLFNLGSGEADMGAQAIVISEGCTALIAISNTREPWTLSFEKLR